MKKIFLFAAVAMVSLSSCVKTNESFTGKVQAIGFKSAVTRGVIQDQADFIYPIAVSAVLDNTEDGVENFKPYFTNAEFVYDSGTWKGVPTRYWPNSGSMYFLAFCPAPKTATMITNYEASTGRIKNLTVSGIDNNIVSQHDVLYSDLLGEIEAPQTDVQALQFHHALAQLNLYFKKTVSGAEVVVNSVLLEGGLFGGTLVINPVEDGESTIEWVNTDSPKNRYFNKDLSVAGIEVGTLDAELVADSNFSPMPLLTIPMDTPGKVKIAYTVDGHQQVAEVDLATKSDKWEAGFKYNYYFTVNVNEIHFDCTVDGWEVVNYDSPGFTI